MYKKKAVFMIVLIVTTIFYSANIVRAEETPGCCVDDSGRCYLGTTQSTCNSKGGTWSPESTCSISACEENCCVLGENCIYTTQRSCALQSREMGFDLNFQEIADEISCLELCEEDGEGCCVYEDLSCIYGNSGGCLGEFFGDKFCSEVRDCFCEKHDHKGCYNDDVYWFDSCDNREDLFKECDYGEGNKCREKDGEFDCRTLDCEDTYDPPVGTNLHDSRMGGFRKNGESWCVYESGTGNFLDRPGSRHYRHLCFEGEEMLMECSDFREEFCVQGDVTIGGKTFTEAQCIQNTNSSLTTVPYGFNFWDSESESYEEGSEKCDEADLECPLVIWRKNQQANWHMSPEVCVKQEFLDNMTNYCRSLGDCGVGYTVLGEKTESGFSVSLDRIDEWHGFKPKWYNKGETFDPNLWNKWDDYGVFGGVQILSDAISEKSPDFGDIGAKEIAYGGTGIAVALWLITKVVLDKTLVAVILSGFGGIEAFIPFVGWIMLALSVITLIGLGPGEHHNHYVKSDCNPWSAPTENQNCSACNEPWKVCSEYKCRSLGQNCKFFNAGTGNETCLEVNINDVNGPLIEPWEEVLTEGYTIIAEGANGFQISPQVKPYSTINLGIKTFDPGRNEYEPTQCKMDTNRSMTYDEMQGYYLSDSIYVEEHLIQLNLEPNKQFTYWVICQDGNGNPSIPYQIKLQTELGPDLNAPIIEGTSLDNGAYVPYGIGHTELTLYTNEPASCRWSKQDIEYDLMIDGVFIKMGMDRGMEYYKADTVLTNITNEETNIYYFRCEDDAGNQNQQGYAFSLVGTPRLDIVSIEPSGTLLVNNFTLRVNTFGGFDSGRATCTYGQGSFGSTRFEVTGDTLHTQQISGLDLGDYEYYVSCSDSVGNNAQNKTEIRIDADVTAPDVVYIYKDTAVIHLILAEESYCEYSDTSFSYGNGEEMAGGGTTHHTAALQDHYYVICRDAYGNEMDPILIFSELY